MTKGSKLWVTALEVIGVGLSAIAFTLLIGIVLAGCVSNVPKVPPTHVTIIQPVQTTEGVGAVIVSKPIPGQICKKQNYHWYCYPAPASANQ